MDSPPEPSEPSQKPMQWRLSDLLWLSFLLPLCGYWIFHDKGGDIVVQNNFGKDEVDTFGVGIILSLVTFVVFWAVCLYFLTWFFRDRDPRLKFRWLRMLVAALLPAVLIVKIFMHQPYKRISFNENRAITACKTFVTAEDTYRRNDHDGDGVLEYATTLKELYSGGKTGLISPGFADAEGKNGTPRSGYVFKVLTGQSARAPGGERSYINKDGNMTVGYALVAWPAVWNETGRNSFMISGSGTIYQHDHGPNTAQIIDTVTAFDPPSSWGPPSIWGSYYDYAE